MVQKIEDLVYDVINNSLHTALPGKILSYDTEKGMAAVQPYGTYQTPDGRKLNYPILSNVPVLFSGTAGTIIAFPIQKEDECLLIISEQELDSWLYHGVSENILRYDLSNAIAIPGLMRTGRKEVKEAIEKEAIIIHANNTKLTISNHGIQAEGNIFIQGNITCTGTIKGSNL